MNFRPVGPALLVALSFCSCWSPSGRREPLRLATEPAGARVVIDGRDSGFVTPCTMDLEIDRDEVRVDFQLDGYQTASRILEHGKMRELLLWNEQVLTPHTFRSPIWINFYDGIEPLKLRHAYLSNNIFVRLQLGADL